MRIYFLTREPDVCQLLADSFTKPDNEIKIFPIITKLFQTVFDEGILPDILFLDFLYFQSDGYDFYSILKKKNKIFPVVHYNHPFPIASKRKYFWSFNLQKTGYFKDLSKIEPLLSTMENALQDPQIAPYVSCIQQPQPYKSSDLRYIEPLRASEIAFYTERFDNVITDKINSTKKECISYSTSNFLNLNSTDQRFTNEFRSRNHLSHKISLLFTYLYSKRNLHVTLEELKNVLSKDSKPETPNGIRLAIYRLRTILKEDVKTHFEILNYDYGYSLVENED